MKEAVKMWANNNREAKSILNYYYACGATLDGKPYDDSDVVHGGYYMYENKYITHSKRTDYEYYSNQENKEIFFATPVKLSEIPTSFPDKCVEVPIVSDGGSTSYYSLAITNKAGEYISCQVGDVIRAMVGNDFDLGNVLKACRRMYEASQGRGKADVTMHYDANKIAYFSKEFADWNEDSE